MVYIKNWSDFETVRYCVKFRPKEGHLVLKVTDDIKCLKYKTYSSIILNRFESLNLRLLTSMASPRVRAVPTIAPTATSAPTEDKVEGNSSAEAMTVATGGAAGKSASKKKKKGKK
ncbi:hypothetical protein QFC21_005500 [Naganishia friedmannii]|uniref:Uncharacterized protein n=1 Tax=Naganishia friedmannii TaxID=89922 RepID=A0ACC2V8Z2_9TREE|nr:hypothetical protein QFC21_005500 [Naganishia friedmannii]